MILTTTDLAREWRDLENQMADVLDHDHRIAQPDLNAEFEDLNTRIAELDDLFYWLRRTIAFRELDLDPELDDIELHDTLPGIHDPDRRFAPPLTYWFRDAMHYLVLPDEADPPTERGNMDTIEDVMPVGADDPEPIIDMSGAPAHPDEATAYQNEPPYDPAYDEPVMGGNAYAVTGTVVSWYVTDVDIANEASAESVDSWRLITHLLSLATEIARDAILSSDGWVAYEAPLAIEMDATGIKVSFAVTL